LGLAKKYFTLNPLPWMSQITDLPKETNFFEAKVKEYSSVKDLKWNMDENKDE
jgi:ribonucleoside-diphosphate reductase beta chain